MSAALGVAVAAVGGPRQEVRGEHLGCSRQPQPLSPSPSLAATGQGTSAASLTRSTSAGSAAALGSQEEASYLRPAGDVMYVNTSYLASKLCGRPGLPDDTTYPNLFGEIQTKNTFIDIDGLGPSATFYKDAPKSCPPIMGPPGLEDQMCSPPPSSPPAIAAAQAAREVAPAAPLCASALREPSVAGCLSPKQLSPQRLVLSLASTVPTPELGSPELPSVGSMQHRLSLECKPCAHYHGRRGCDNGVNCPFCHLCRPGELKRRQRLERQKATRPMQQPPTPVAVAPSARWPHPPAGPPAEPSAAC